MDRTVTFETLVDAYFEAAEYASWHRDVSGYHAVRRDILASLFGCSLEDPPPRGEMSWSEERDRRLVREIARACLSRETRPSSVFGEYLEGRPGPLEAALRARHEAKLDRALETVRARRRAIFRDALLVAYPEAESKAFRAELLVERGLPAEPPDPTDYL